MPPLPSLPALARRIRVLMDATCGDEAVEPAGNGQLLKRGARAAVDQEDALRSLVSTIPAVTIADAAAQLWVAELAVTRIDDFDLPKREQEGEIDRIRRLIRSALLVVAQAAGTSAKEIAGPDWMTLYRGDFPTISEGSVAP